jgi:hypothetical protein
MLTDRSNRARMIGMLIGIALFIVAVLVKRLR